MRNITKLSIILGAAMAVAVCGNAFAQNDNNATAPAKAAMPEARFFHLDFVVKEVELGKVITSRSFATSVSDQPDSFCSIRAGARIPARNGSGDFHYLDAGVNVDCSRVRMKGSELVMNVSSDVSTFAMDLPQERSASGASEPPSAPVSVNGAPLQPVVRQNKWSATVTLPLGKPTVLFSSDDVTSKRRMVVELTATEIK